MGILKSQHPARRREQFEALVSAATVLSLDKDAAIAAAGIRTTLEANGQGIGPMDTLIAGTALAHNAVLVTHNTREFARVPGMQITDWYAAG